MFPKYTAILNIAFGRARLFTPGVIKQPQYIRDRIKIDAILAITKHTISANSLNLRKNSPV